MKLNAGKRPLRIQPESSVPRWLRLLFMAVFVVIVVAWFWEWLGPDRERVRQHANSLLRGIGTTYGSLFYSGIALIAGGYLLWRFLAWYYWRKYFDDREPPEAKKK